VKKLSTGIYADAYSIQAIVNAAGGRKTKRFAHDTSLVDIKRWRTKTKAKLDALASRRPKHRAAGTLRADVKLYLKTTTVVDWKTRRSELEAWVQEYGGLPRWKLTLEHVRAAVRKWQTEGRLLRTEDGKALRRPYAAWTIRHRVHALRDLYHVLDGRDEDGRFEPTPCDGLKLPRPPETTPVFVTPATILQVAQRLDELAADPHHSAEPDDIRKTRARHLVLATCGARPCELMRALPTDVDLKVRLWPVRTAKGGIGRVLRLNTPDMVRAWRTFIAADAWGSFDTSLHAKRVRRAGWPKGVRPYALRGTWGMEISRSGADLADVQQLLGHADIRTTRAYYVPAEDSRLAKATRATAGRLRWK
jgi:integrase